MLLAYDDVGSGPVVLLLHGFPLDRTMWQAQREALSHRYRVITPDLRGHGETPAPEGIYPIEDMANDVVELLDTLRINEPIVLGGLSMGGYVALAMAVRHPKRLRGLMLMNTRAGPDSPEAARQREESAQRVEASGSVEPVVTAMIPRLFSEAARARRADLVARLQDQMLRTPVRGVAGALRGMAIRPDRTGDLGRIKVPTLVLAGTDDAIVPTAEAQRMADALPHAQFVVIADVGHLAPVEDPAAVNEALLKFLGSLA